MFSNKQSIEYEELANPNSWFLIASELHEQAKILKSANGVSTIFHYNDKHEVMGNWRQSNRAVFLLCGFALENIVKAFLIYEHPEYIEGGSLSRHIKTHSLTRLADKSSVIPYKKSSVNTLRYFEEGLDTWARYPCGLNWSKTKSQAILTDKMWGNYRWLMKAYEKRFKKVMTGGWQGVHGFKGRFVIEGPWLD